MTDIGYHFIIAPDGTIYEGRDIGVRGNHVSLNNTGRIEILLLGDFQPGPWWDFNDDPKPTTRQEQSALQLVQWLDSEYGIDHVLGHRDILNANDNPDDATECPGDNAMYLIPILNASVQ